MTKPNSIAIFKHEGGGYLVDPNEGAERGFTTFHEAVAYTAELFGEVPPRPPLPPVYRAGLGEAAPRATPTTITPEMGGARPGFNTSFDSKWIIHIPGPCPVAPDRIITGVLYRNGEEERAVPGLANRWDWKERGSLTIVAYKVPK